MKIIDIPLKKICQIKLNIEAGNSNRYFSGDGFIDSHGLIDLNILYMILTII